MKGCILFVILILFLVGMVSAAYNCSFGNLVEDKEEISVGGIKTINNLQIGLIKSDSSILDMFSATVMIDAVEFSVSNTTNVTEEVELMEEEPTITLLNLTEDMTKLKVESDSEEIIIADEEITTIGGFEVYVTSTTGVYPGIGTVEGMIGSDSASLTNENYGIIKTIDNVEYVVQLFSASDTDATIIVGKCEDEGAIINEIEDVVVNVSLENSTTLNDTINETSSNVATTENDSINESEFNTENDSINESEFNGSSEQTSDNGTTVEGGTEKSFFKSGEGIFKMIVIVILVLIVIAFAIFVIHLWKSDKEKGIIES